MFEVTLWPIVAAGVANVILGAIWFHPKVFGSAWMAAAGISPGQPVNVAKMVSKMAVAFLAAMVAAYVMNYFGIAWGVWDWIGAVELAFWCWLGFAAVPMLGTVLWDGKSFKYYAIVSGFWLVSFILMAVTLILMAPSFEESFETFDESMEVSEVI